MCTMPLVWTGAIFQPAGDFNTMPLVQDGTAATSLSSSSRSCMLTLLKRDV